MHIIEGTWYSDWQVLPSNTGWITNSKSEEKDPIGLASLSFLEAAAVYDSSQQNVFLCPALGHVLSSGILTMSSSQALLKDECFQLTNKLVISISTVKSAWRCHDMIHHN